MRIFAEKTGALYSRPTAGQVSQRPSPDTFVKPIRYIFCRGRRLLQLASFWPSRLCRPPQYLQLRPLHTLRSLPPSRFRLSQCQRHEFVLAAPWWFPFHPRHPFVLPIRIQDTRFHVVRQLGREQLLGDSSSKSRIFNRKHCLNSSEEVPRHPIRTPYKDLRITPIFEIDHPRVFQESPNDGPYRDVLTHPLDPRPQTANPANHQIDFHPRLAGTIERLDRFPIHQRIHFRNDPRRLPGLRICDFPLDESHHVCVHREWRNEKLARSLELPKPREQVE